MTFITGKFCQTIKEDMRTWYQIFPFLPWLSNWAYTAQKQVNIFRYTNQKWNKSEISNENFYIKKLEKKEQIKDKNNTRAQIIEIVKKKKIQKSQHQNPVLWKT